MSGDACLGCTGSCCEGVVVGVTGYDAYRLAAAHGVDLDAAITIATADASDPGAFRFDGEYAVLVLQRHPHRPRACTFLAGLDDEVRRCGTYATRPVVCRTYPMRWSNGRVSLRDDVACASDAWEMATIAEPVWRADLSRYAFEWAIYERVVAVWNRGPVRDVATYLAFVMRSFAAIESIGCGRDGHGDGIERSEAAGDRFFAEVERIAERALFERRSED